MAEVTAAKAVAIVREEAGADKETAAVGRAQQETRPVAADQTLRPVANKTASSGCVPNPAA